MHSGPYLFPSFPDPKFSYDYNNPEYEPNGVIKVTVFNSRGFKIREMEYNSESFLFSEAITIAHGIESHKYSYSNNRLVVQDTIKRFLYSSNSDEIINYSMAPLKTDSFFSVEKRIFDTEKRLLSVRLLPINSINGIHLNKVEYPYGDSLFYTYDSCGNCVELRSYKSGEIEITNFKFHYPTSSVNGIYGVYISHYDPEFGTEEWNFNSKLQLILINHREERVFIKSLDNRVIGYEHWMVLQGVKTVETTSYSYNKMKKLQEVSRIGSRTPVREYKIKLKRYKNGLQKVDQEGNTFIYTLKN